MTERSSSSQIATRSQSRSRTPPSHTTTASPSQSSNKRKRSTSPSHSTPTAKSPSPSSERSSTHKVIATTAPPLPSGPTPPPLPSEPVPTTTHTHEEPLDDGWAPVWDASAQAYYFYNRFTQATQWENPRVPTATLTGAPGTLANSASRVLGAPPGDATLSNTGATPTTIPPTTTSDEPTSRIRPAVAGGYNPAIHGDYDPNADYAQHHRTPSPTLIPATIPGVDPTTNATHADLYAATAQFNRFTGRFQPAAVVAPENFNDENKSKRQMNAYFDVDAAANSHDGRSLKAERAGKRLSKDEVKAFKERRREKKEEKRRAWLRD